jgi:UbiD family decarboxylase
MSSPKINDLRSALECLKKHPNEFVETDIPVDPFLELTGVYRRFGARGTCMRPTKIGPAMMFNNIKGYKDARVLIGLFGSRERIKLFLGAEPERLSFLLSEAFKNPIEPIVTKEPPPCQEVVHYAKDKDFDIRKLLPVFTGTELDGGPFINSGLCYASDPETGKSDVTIHRLCVQSRDEITCNIVNGRHIGEFYEKAEKMGKPLPLSISIGVDPAIEIGACVEAPTTPLGFDELAIAGALRKEPVKLSQCLTIDEKAIANAEYVLEGELLPGVYIDEDQTRKTGYAIPEFPGYMGRATTKESIGLKAPVFKVKAVTHRKNPIFRNLIGCSEEHVNMVGLPTEASIFNMVEKAMPGKLLNVYCPPSGGGKLCAILQFRKSEPSDEGRQRQAALLAFSAFSELKHVTIVDDDVDIFDPFDVMWAMTTRYQGDIDTIFIKGVKCHVVDPSSSPDYNPYISQRGIACKTIFDCTVPYHLKNRFKRAKFMDIDPKKWDINV